MKMSQQQFQKGWPGDPGKTARIAQSLLDRSAKVEEHHPQTPDAEYKNADKLTQSPIPPRPQSRRWILEYALLVLLLCVVFCDHLSLQESRQLLRDQGVKLEEHQAQLWAQREAELVEGVDEASLLELEESHDQHEVLSEEEQDVERERRRAQRYRQAVMADSWRMLASTEEGVALAEKKKKPSFKHNLQTIFKRIDGNLQRLLELEEKLKKQTKSIQEHQAKNQQKNKDQDLGIGKLKKEDEKIQASIKTMEGSLSDLKKLQEKQKDSLNSQKDKLNKESLLLKKAIKDKSDIFKKDLKKLDKNEIKTSDELKKTEESLTKFIKDQKKKVADLKSSIASLKSEQDKTKKEVSSIQDQLKELNKVDKITKKQIEDLNKEIADTNKKLAKQNVETEKEISSLTKSLKDTDSNIKSMKKDEAKVDKSLEEKNKKEDTKIAELEKGQSKHTADISSLSKKAGELTTRAGKVEDRVKILETQNANFKVKIEELLKFRKEVRDFVNDESGA